MKKSHSHIRIRVQWLLFFYDTIIYGAIAVLCAAFPSAYFQQELHDVIIQSAVMYVCIFSLRFIFLIYKRIWRYEGVWGYLVLIGSDLLALVLFSAIYYCLPIKRNFLMIIVAMGLLNLLCCLTARLIYRYLYKFGIQSKFLSKLFTPLLSFLTGGRIENKSVEPSAKINIAVAGAGRTGESFVYDLTSNPAAYYNPVFFIDAKPYKTGKIINDLHVYPEDERVYELLKENDVKEVVIAVPNASEASKRRMYDFYRKSNCKVKIYDYSTTSNADNKRHMRDFDIEDLMPRSQVDLEDDSLASFYVGRRVLITGGGGSIGSEMARQIYAMKPKKIVILDVYENGAYDIAQDFAIKNADEDDTEICVEICSITDKLALENVFAKHKPEIVIHAAAHKHVPLMETNTIEAIKNNIFGTLNVIEACENNGVFKMMTVSTDKAVNPTNVMGATKRFCEMMVFAKNSDSKVRYGATRFGNVLGSAGSVVPLFRRQIANGGPVTVTDKRIVRYFMTIPEACNLVLQASVMTNDGELFVLDMGSPVRIWDLAKNMIEVSGVSDIEIIETGLRPGEKLYEELLIQNSENHEKTDNELIYIEKNHLTKPLDEIKKHLDALREVCESGDEGAAREALKDAVPEFKDPADVNNAAAKCLEPAS